MANIPRRAVPVARTVTDPRPALPSSSPRILLHLVPVAALALPLFGLVVSDFVRDLKKPAPAAIEDEPVIQEAANHEAILAKAPPRAEVLDEPDEIVTLPAKVQIDDEPEERLTKAGPVKVEIKDEPDNAGAAPIATDQNPLVGYTLNNAQRSFGISTTASAGTAANKLLTYAVDGQTNSTVMWIDNFAGPVGNFGRWTRWNAQRLEDGIVPTPYGIMPSHSTFAAGNVLLHQVLEIVPGQAVLRGNTARRQYDAVIVRWIMHNRDKREHKVGLRLQLDTLIGGNDGVPFTVPGQAGLVDTFADYRGPQVPDFVQALEQPNLQNPGTVAHLTLKLGSSIEPPDRLSLTHWPGVNFNWELPVVPLTGDSAAVLYWSPKPLKAGGKRIVGFSYGLGSVAYKDKLGVTLGGSFEPGQQFTVTAYVENPAPGQTVRLELPAGLRRRAGEETQTVPAARRNAPSLVTWKVEVQETGTFRLVVHASTGISQAKTISIARPDAGPTGTLALNLQGSFEPGQTFDVVAAVGEPVAGQKVTLQIPLGLTAIEGATEQPVSMPAAGATESVVRWKVRVLHAGKYAVRVVSSTGIAQTKTITIVQPGAVATNFRIALDGDFAPGKTFTVSAHVTDPVPAQKLTLQLPAGLDRTGGEPEQTVPAGRAPALRWQVKVLRAGKFTVGVASSTGVIQRKSLLIAAPGAPGAPAGPFTFELSGDIRVGKTFEVVARVAEPVAGQSLTLTLPAELKLAGGAQRQALGQVGTPTTVTWQVEVLRAGRLPVRVESSTGLVRTKTVVLAADADSTLFGR